MDNKLSKPVAEIVSKFGDPEAFGEREIKLLTGIQQMAYGTKFYSQEYVSALLAELEAKDQAHRVHAARLISERGVLRERVTELEAKLATPVRLPTKYSLKMAGDKSTRAMFSGHNSAINDSADAIRAAGFKVEGDE